MIGMTRREFGRLALTGAPLLAQAKPPAGGNRSFIGGVQFGLQPFCYHDLPMTPENRPTLISRLVQNGMGVVELHATWVEPRFGGPGVGLFACRRMTCFAGVCAPEELVTVQRLLEMSA